MRTKLDSTTPFNLDATLCCGQAFRWNKQGEWWYGIAKDKAFKIRQTEDHLEYENVNADFVNDYFSLTDDLPKIYSKINKDAWIREATRTFKGLRILRQDPWECLISYICATYKNIPAIRQMLLNLSRKFGNKTQLDGSDFFTFPTAEKLAESPKSGLAECGLGYRAKYVQKTAKIVHEDPLGLENLSRASYTEARARLLDFLGVGMKVADCVLLFSMRKLEAFPIDVWMKKSLLRHYSHCFPKEEIDKALGTRSPTKKEYEMLNSFGQEYFGEYAGYAQEYLYHHERMGK